MKILHKYIARQFLSTTIFAIVAFTILFVAINLMEELDDFLDKKVSTDVIIEYYIAYIPEIIKLITPIAVLLSSLFTTGKLTNTNEITAMKASGMSMFQYLRPIFLYRLQFLFFQFTSTDGLCQMQIKRSLQFGVNI